ncbi:MAG: hydroxyacid dehydrogenase [Magnetovibrio sp.]|nr:hydroxyacid dehydrogenase [Magnetovibrio sp.]
MVEPIRFCRSRYGEASLNRFPGKDEVIVHFAHPAYLFGSCLKARDLGLNFIETRTQEETHARITEGHVLVVSGFWENAYIRTGINLKFIQACGAGYNQFDLDALATKGLRLANASGANVNAVSDHAIALMLCLVRKIHHARDNQRAHHWRGMISEISQREAELAGKTLIIFGMGAIGGRLAKLAKAFDMNVIGIRRNIDPIKSRVDEAYTPQEFFGLLHRADFVALTCPLTDETANIINETTLAAMRNDAYLINVARGGCVDESALVDALSSGSIAGAGIDTTAEEPLANNSALWEMSNVILTPHTAGETQAYEENVLDILLDNLDRLSRGQMRLHNQII